MAARIRWVLLLASVDMTNGRGITQAWPPRAPLRSVWRQPRATLARLSHDNPGYGVFVLPVLASFATYPVANLTFGEDAADVAAGYVAQSLLSFSPALELFQLFVGAFVISRLAPLFAGRGNSRRLLTALAWSNLPIAVLAPLSFGVMVFAELMDASNAGGNLPLPVLLPALLVQVAAIVWAKYLLVVGCAGALSLSLAKTVVCLSLAWLLSAALLGGVVFLTLGVGAVPPFLFIGLPEAFLGSR